MRFVCRLEAGERMTDLCQEFGISRKTGYKIWNRYLHMGPEGLFDFSRRPDRQWQKTSIEIEELVEKERLLHPTWGPKKLKNSLEKRQPGVRLPAHSTISSILTRRGLIKLKKRPRRNKAHPSERLGQSYGPNDIWTADYKGQFQLKNGKYCYPLTITDHYSRYFISCEAFESIRGEQAKLVFAQCFREHGLPKAIRTDNGAPFASVGLYGLTGLSVWWKRLGIKLERIEPGHPEQNGRHERLHLTLKKEATRPAGSNFLQQQEKFDRFREEYNNNRPHEALGMKRPDEVYRNSNVKFRENLEELTYPTHDMTRRVRSNGRIRFQTRQIYLSRALDNQKVGLRETEPGQWLVSFMDLDLGYIDSLAMEFVPI